MFTATQEAEAGGLQVQCQLYNVVRPCHNIKLHSKGVEDVVQRQIVWLTWEIEGYIRLRST